MGMGYCVPFYCSRSKNIVSMSIFSRKCGIWRGFCLGRLPLIFSILLILVLLNYGFLHIQSKYEWKFHSPPHRICIFSVYNYITVDLSCFGSSRKKFCLLQIFHTILLATTKYYSHIFFFCFNYIFIFFIVCIRYYLQQKKL